MGFYRMALRNKPRTVRFRELGIYVFESKHRPDFVMETDSWDFQKLALIIKGAGFLEVGETQIPLGENQLVYVPASLPHRFADDSSNPMTLVMSCFYDDMFVGGNFAGEALADFQKAFQAAAPFNLSDNFTRVEVMDKFRRMLFEQIHRRQNCRAVIWCELLELLVFLTRTYHETQKLQAESAGSRAFAGSVRYLENNFYKPIKIEQLAAIANMSYRRFTEHFKKTTDKTVIERLAELRIEYAKKLMAETENVLYAAFESGFGDITHFYRIFKRVTGKTPKQYISEIKHAKTD